jgi:hypothetical protein
VPIADTTRMTNGVSATMVVYGEDGDDNFEVNHNAAKLFLHGGDGDDTFIINTFITLRQQTPEGVEIANLNTLFGGAGNNRYEYVQNAPVFIDGGAGTDTIVLNGTPIGDTFVITRNSVAGAGRVTYFTGVERLEINGGGGDDQFYVLSTDPSMELDLNGGSGDDTVHLGGDAPPMIFDLPPFHYTPPAFQVQDPAVVVYDTRDTIDIGRIVLTRDFNFLSGDWFSFFTNPAQYARNLVTAYLFAWLAPFELRPFSDILAGDPNDPQVQGETDDQRANQGFFGLNGLFDLIDRTVDSVQFLNISPWWFFGEGRITFSFDPAAFTYRIGHEVLPPPRIVQPSEIIVDPPAFAYDAGGVHDLSGIQGKLVVDGGTAFETAGDTLVVHDQDGAVHSGTLTSDHLQGFGLGAGTVNGGAYNGVEYHNLESVDVRLSNSATPDTLTIEGTHAGDTRVVLGDGDDVVNIKGIGGTLEVLGGAGNDTVNVHNDASTLDAVAARLSFLGDADIVEHVFTLAYDPATQADIIANAPFVYVNTDPNGAGHQTFTPANGTGASFNYQQEQKGQIVFVKDLDANGADAGDEVWVRAAVVSPDGQHHGRQERGVQQTGVLQGDGSIKVTNQAGDALIWLTADGLKTLTNTGVQSILITNAVNAAGVAGDHPIFLDDNNKRTTTDTGRQSLQITDAAADGLLWLNANNNPTTVNTGKAYIAGGILVENKIQERGVQQVGFQETGKQERGIQERGRQAVDADGNLVFLEANGDETLIDTGIQKIVVTNATTDALLWLDFRGRRTLDNTGTQSVQVTSSGGLLYLDANGARTTTNTGVQSIAITNTTADAKLWIDVNGHLTTTRGNTAALTGSGAQQRGFQQEDSGGHALFHVSATDSTLTTAVTQFPAITVTNDPFDKLLYVNSAGRLTTDPGNKMAIASGFTAADLAAVNHGLSVVSIWVEDDNDQTTTNTGFKSFADTDSGKIPGSTTTLAPLLWVDQAGRRVDSQITQTDNVNGVNVVIFRSPPSLLSVQASTDRPILHTEDLYETKAGTDTLNIVDLTGGTTATLDSYARAVDTFDSQGHPVFHAAGDPAKYLGGEPVVDPLTGLPELYQAGDDLTVYDVFTRQPVTTFDAEGNVVNQMHNIGDAKVHFRDDAVVHVKGERVEYLGDEPVFGQNGQQVKDVLNHVILHAAGEPVLGGQPVIVRDATNHLRLLLTDGSTIALTATTVLTPNVVRYTSDDAQGQLFYQGGEAAFFANTDPVQAAQQFARFQADDMGGLIEWTGVDSVNVTLGGGADDVTVAGTQAGGTTVNLGGGDDHARVMSVSGATTINGGDGADSVDVYNADARLYDIDATLTINGGNGADTANLINTFDFAGTPGTLTGTTLSGLGMGVGGSIVYGTVETLNLSLGVGDDDLTIASTAANVQTNVFGDLGDDVVTVQSTAAGSTTNLFLAQGADTVNITGSGSNGLQAIRGDLIVAADLDGLTDGQTNTLNITDTTSVDKNGAFAGSLTASTFAGLAMGGIIQYGGFEVLNLTLGNGADGLEVLSTMGGTTNISGGSGANDLGDTIKIEALAGEVNVFGGTGNDSITLFDGAGDFAAPGSHLTIDGATGDDTITLNLGRRTGLAIDVTDSNPVVGLDNLIVNGTDDGDAVYLGAGDKTADITAGVLAIGQKVDALGRPLYYRQATSTGLPDGDPLFDADGLPLFALDAFGNRIESTDVSEFPILLDNPSRDTVSYARIDVLTVNTLGGDDVVQTPSRR